MRMSSRLVAPDDTAPQRRQPTPLDGRVDPPVDLSSLSISHPCRSLIRQAISHTAGKAWEQNCHKAAGARPYRPCRLGGRALRALATVRGSGRFDGAPSRRRTLGGRPWPEDETEGISMWIETTASGIAPRIELICDECGAIFEGEPRPDRQSYWQLANVAGWARVSRAPDRHLCANC